MRWAILLFWLLLCFGVSAIGARWNLHEIPGWYRTLSRPSFCPPNVVFGPVWSLLYLLMALAAWKMSLSPPSPVRTAGLILFATQLALNLAWSYIFFQRHAIGAALCEIVFLWIAIGATLFAASRLSPIAAWMLAPYWAWVTFATALNFSFWRLNR